MNQVRNLDNPGESVRVTAPTKITITAVIAASLLGIGAFVVPTAASTVKADKPLAKLQQTNRLVAAPKSSNPSAMRKAVKCEEMRIVCNQAAWRRLPMRSPDPLSATTMTEQQAIAEVGWKSGMGVGASEMSYGQASKAYPSLAADSFVDPTRTVWVVTVYYSQAMSSASYSPPQAAPTSYSSATVIIDAASGNETDWCLGCSMIPASSAAAKLAERDATKK